MPYIMENGEQMDLTFAHCQILLNADLIYPTDGYFHISNDLLDTFDNDQNKAFAYIQGFLYGK